MKTAVTHRFRGRRFIGAAILGALILVWTAHASIRATQPPNVGAEGARTFVGAEACASCHQDIHETWKGGRHSKMLQPATAASVKGDFSKGSVTLHGERYPAARRRTASTSSPSRTSPGKEQEHRVEYTLGSRRIQHYLTTIDKGRIIVLPPSWDVQRREWFDNMDIVRPDENDQKPVQQWNKNCVGCHVSQQENNYRPATGTYATQVERLRHVVRAVSWPGQRARRSVHARRTRARRAAGERIDRPADAPRSDDEQHDLRAVPLAARRRSTPDYTAGENYYDYFMPRARVRAAQGSGSDLLGRRPAAPVLERRDRPVAERVLSARRRDVHELPQRSARARHRQEPAAGADATTRCAPDVTRISARG